jgi:site-specific recombinase XerD
MADPLRPPSFATLLQRFFAEHLTQHRSVSPRTIAAYRDTFRLLLLFTERRIGKAPTAVVLADFDAPLVLAFLDHLEAERGNGARTRNARLTAIRSFLGYAAHHDLSALPTIQRTLAIPVKRFDRPMLGFLSRDDMHAVLDAPDLQSWIGQRDRALLTTMYNTGARVSEIIGVRIGDLVLDGAPCVHLHGKGRKQRTVPLWRTTAALLRAWTRQLNGAAAGSPLFPNRGGTEMTRSNVTQRLALCVQTAATNRPHLLGRSISPHTIRHTTAMHLLQSGVDITVIALWLGHESPATTHLYIEADLGMKERALGHLQPPGNPVPRYRPPDALMRFLQSL